GVQVREDDEVGEQIQLPALLDHHGELADQRGKYIRLWRELLVQAPQGVPTNGTSVQERASAGDEIARLEPQDAGRRGERLPEHEQGELGLVDPIGQTQTPPVVNVDGRAEVLVDRRSVLAGSPRPVEKPAHVRSIA